ncbi:carbon-nitrogen hydrolase family protein [Paenactinomyces guangxiensis]|uniref:Carbon-nitrogen hydrolase family protein n=1 Tax=Paenactinomyces guangxiensis TaxID=1490290 RepID=A0A7W1WRQ7_9BACL|nr:carbon-nitrogen hydrolase family protein [Paenactinomyces guangxiensis]MBA4494859.1 carbon-nitrogen hydrolase family protein [Paenactinomyces guangxiensis]MBH8591942.1 carbon-nitrogen hydrolase family protein [Paenactinomyces guangxiensis]
MLAHVGVVQYAIRPLSSEKDFWKGIQNHVRAAGERGVELLVFPEYLTAHLLALQPALPHHEACAYLNGFTDSYIRFFRQLSRDTGIMIVAGTHIHEENGAYVNESFFFFPTGRIERQKKLHLTPEERKVWKLTPGENLQVFDTPVGKVAILICYDIEFPELSRIVSDEKVEIILNPTYTDTMAGYYRIRHCAQARAVENQRYIAVCGMTGKLPEVPQIDTGYSQSGFFSPCDHPFPPDGVLSVCEANVETLVSYRLDLNFLKQNWEQGQVSPYKDRKQELYHRLERKPS